MSTRNMQGVVSPIIPASYAGGSNYSGVYTLDQLNRLNAFYPNHIGKSLRFRSSASAYLNRTPSVAGNRQTWTWSGWVKRGTLGTSQVLFDCEGGSTDTTFGEFGFTGSDTFEFIAYTFQWRATTQVFRDPSAWYHLVVAFDTTQAVAANRVKIYLNGTQITAFSVSNDPTQNTSYAINQAAVHNIAKVFGGRGYFDGYMAEVNFIDGQALTPSSFGQISFETGVWIPKAYTGAYGTNGFYLKFSDTTSTTTLCYDYSGNSNNWTPNNISLTAGSTYDSMLDSPTPFASGNGVGNYCVCNPLDTSGSTINANLSVSTSGYSGYGTTRATFGMSSGKWYWEVTPTSFGDGGIIGISTASASISASLGANAYGWGYLEGGSKYNNASATAYGASYTTNDVIGVAFDADSGTLTFYKNNTSQGIAFSGLISGPYFPTISDNGGGSTGSVLAVTFGQRPFAYTPPTGYKALNTQNLPAPSIQNGSNFMAATTYTGTGATQTIVNANNSVSFQPDLVWIKSRSAATDHALYDVIRGTQNRLESNTTDAAVAADNGLTAFNSNGFTVNTLAQVNTNAATYVGWQWKAGGTAVTNTAGSITSSVSANTTAGFSVVTYTGNGTASTQTIGHGLSSGLSMVIIKARVTGGNDNGWGVSHTSIAAPSYLYLNTTDAAGNLGPAQGQPSIGTGNTFKVLVGTTGTNNFNASGVTYVAYCFAAIPGYSAFGSYTGNGSSDGPFTYTGFRPRYLLIKNSTAASQWRIADTSRSPYNQSIYSLRANDSTAENSTNCDIDFLSNGFKIRGTGTDQNDSGNVYVFAAFAENPFNYSLAR